MLKDLVKANRSYRGYDEGRCVTKEELLEALPLLLLKGDSILVKASHFMEFPEIVSFLEKEGNR